ncbi:TAT-variant-translocated molybdopterin oxidoreductase [Luteolibacter pohnpeiensis]|uniref:TAT-variant-translocated molybdopterin oxidoreductase n=1 Tax=Luteolibacter pohnpeiensis TaxID=454153 RepID=A0A934VQG1_9BACT|nr:TAT-variant-translocated molybdopterin oxidoreductase [Luteolibacter pohnpeiensis]MBK1882066.1 TAT-variant-translocated molybdopterin oxidoreductase [Luteolibacter pohnpeiensis]
MKTWRSLDELAGSRELDTWLRDEFPAGAAWLDHQELGSTEIRRRKFIQLMGASLGLAGLTSCGRQPQEKIVPYVDQPENTVPGVPKYYASAISFRGHARGILVESHSGRPTKIEGNPDHPASLGATDAVAQASVLGLYDPDRSKTVLHHGRISTWDKFDEAHREILQRHASESGAGYGILIEPTSSPTLKRLLGEMLTSYPKAKIYQHSGVAPTAPQPTVNFSKPDLILSIDDDFFTNHPDSLRYIREFTSRRKSGSKLNRLYVIEPTPTLTGAKADHRLAVRPSRIELVVNALTDSSIQLEPHESRFVESLRDDLKKFEGKTLIRIGSHLSPNLKKLRSKSIQGQTPPDTITGFPGLDRLTNDLTGGAIQSLLILGGNPIYNTPGDIPFKNALRFATFTAHLASHEDETSLACEWHLPEAHSLETWGDLLSYDGSPSICQPIIEPLYNGRPAICILKPEKAPYELVRNTWQLLGNYTDLTFDDFWKKSLYQGCASPEALRKASTLPTYTETDESSDYNSSLREDQIDLVIQPHPHIGTGEGANNGWLQELPHPFTKIVWDNAALVSPEFAKSRKLKNGDIVRLNQSIEIPIWILPGQADETVTLHTGYGRIAAGELGNGVGTNVFPLGHAKRISSLSNTGKTGELVTTQHHSMMEGRELYWQIDRNHPTNERPPEVPNITLYQNPAELLNGRYAWAMSIDLSSCIGCNACVTACQAENNIPVVGKEEVARGREMHWIRIDRYFIGENESDPRIVYQPVTCQHCEQAPCEVVCPVEATVHTADGLNAMVYNRCVGTRYCTNNCPYKVRRFNFFDYRIKKGKNDPRSLQANPNVTVRGRGVMEKCSYCVQRIQRAVIQADREQRRVREGEIRTACQQACPSEAIIFGDLRNEMSAVARQRKDNSAYSLLGDLNTRPRTIYLAEQTNRHV